MDATEQDKSEQPTSFKLDKARQRGVVARGMDLGFLTGLATLLGYLWVAGPQLASVIARSGHDALIGGPSLADSNGALLMASVLLLAPIVRPLVLMFATVFVGVLVFEIVQTGAVFSTQPLKPDFSRLNPVNGLKRLFSLRLLLETCKNVLKLGAYSTIALLIIRAALQTDLGAMSDGRMLLSLLEREGLRLLGAFVLGAILFVILDQLIVRRQFVNKMRMSRREVRRELREREGEPRLKQKRKQLHREFVKSSQSLRNLRKADVLITNPQHIALALRYDEGANAAPLVVSLGINQLAQRLKRLAFLYGIPIMENKALAQELYRKCALNSAIPEHCYQAVADIYNALRRNRRVEERVEETDKQDVA